MLPNDVQGYKIKPQGFPIIPPTVPRVAANARKDADIEPVNKESASLDDRLMIINDEGGEEFEIYDEEHNEENGASIDNKPDDV